MDQFEESLFKKYEYAKGTDFYLANCKKPIDYIITKQGDMYVFTPSELIKNIFSGVCTEVIKDKSLLSGTAHAMAIAANYCARSSFKSEMTSSHKVDDARFQIPREKVSANLYIDYTNNMVLPDNSEYVPLAPYIFPNYRYSKYAASQYLLPKDLIDIQLKNDIYIQHINSFDAKYYYTKFLDAFKEEKTLTILKALKIKEQIDYPTKLTIFGVANKFAEKDKYGLVGILCIEHKITMEDIQKYKDLCDEKLNELLKPLNLTVNDVKNITDEQLKEEYNTFSKIDKLMRACSMLYDPRTLDGFNMYGYKCTYNYFLVYNDIYSLDEEDNCLKRWGEIKNIYPELYKGLKKIWMYYSKLAWDKDIESNKEYNEKLSKLSKDYYDSLINMDGNILNDKYAAVKIINDALSKIGAISIKNWEDMIDSVDLVNQNILNKLSNVYTLQGKQIIAKYKKEHPRARKMELEIDSELIRIIKGSIKITSAISGLFLYKLFRVKYLPEEYQKILNLPELTLLKDNLERLSLSYGCNINALVNGKKIASKNNNSKIIYYIENIDDALNSLSIELTNEIIYSDNSPALAESRLLKNTFHRNSFGETGVIQVLNYNDYEEIVNLIISSSLVSFKLMWEHSTYKMPSIIYPYSISAKILDDDDSVIKKWGIYGDKTVDDIINDNNIKDKIYDYMSIKIVPVYDNDALLKNLDKFMNVQCIKNALDKNKDKYSSVFK